MRYPSNQKENTRRHIVETVSRAIRRDGIEGSTIVPLMREAGLTQGAFYAHFSNRDEMLLEALEHAVAQTLNLASLWVAAAEKAGQPPIARIIDEYLSERHVDNREATCIVAALGPELWRQSDVVRRNALDAFHRMATLIAAELDPARADMAGPLYSMMAGVLISARLGEKRTDQLTILQNGRRAARVLVGLDA